MEPYKNTNLALLTSSSTKNKKTKSQCLRLIYESLVDYIRLTVPGKYLIERVIWIVVRLLALIALSVVIHNTTEDYRNTPIATGLETDSYPIQSIDFPAVAICNMNAISKSKAINYAEQLWKIEGVRAIANLTQPKILDVLRYFGHLYTFSTKEQNEGDINLLHQVLNQAYNGSYDLIRVVHRLQGNCNDFVARCRWKGVTRTCEDIILPRYTPDGICCTFNYARWNDKFSSDVKNTFKPPIERSEIAGSHYGLWLLLNTMEDDYYYQLLPSTGFKVMVYTPTDYPDAPSGGLKEIIVARGTETLLNIRATVFHTAEEVIDVGENHRQCLFKSELNAKFGGQYSFSDCIMDCRVHDIIKKCGCVPFFYPMPNDAGTIRHCHLLDLQCLHRYKNRWWSIDPLFDQSEPRPPFGTFSEIAEGHLHCYCFPACSNIDYTVFKSASALADETIYWDTGKNAVEKNKSHVILNIFFGSYGAMKLRQDVQYYWYELMSNYGGLCNLFLGLSFMSGIEFVYKFFRTVFGSRKRLQRVFVKVVPHKKATKVKRSQLLEAQPHFYWQEIHSGNFCVYTHDK